MARVRRGFKARRRRNKVMKMAKGFSFDRRNKYRRTVETVRRAMAYMFVQRKRLKRDMRALWIMRIGAGAKLMGTSYSKLMHTLKQNSVTINRKMLADLAATDFDAFKSILSNLK